MSPNKGPLAPHFLPSLPATRGSIRDVKDRLQAPAPPANPGPPPPWRGARPARAVRRAAAALAPWLLAAPALLQASPGSLPAAELAQALALAQQAAEQALPAGAVVQARLGRLDQRLRPAPCQRAQAFLPRGVPTWGNTRVGMRCLEGPVRWTLYLPVEISVQAPALSLRGALPAGSVLGEQDLVLAPLAWPARVQPLLTEPAQALGRTLARAVEPGRPLLESDLAARRWFASGDTVKVLSGGPGFQVAAEARALGEGRDRQRVRVRLLLRDAEGRESSGPVLQGIAVGERLVELML